MIKLNHKHKQVEALVKDLIDDALKTTNMENFDLEETSEELLVSGRHKGYLFSYARNKETCEVTVHSCWQLTKCPNPIFEV